MKVIIVGGVAGGASTAARLRRLDESAEIILFEKGEFVSFANCGLPYYIGNKIEDDSELILQTPEDFRARFRIDVRIFNEVIALNRQAQTVTIKNLIDGTIYEEHYDRLVLSPGAAPLRPNFIGSQLDRVFTLRTIPDTKRIKQYIQQKQPKNAAVVGGGFIGLEMVENLVEQGITTHLIELSNQVLPPLDFDMATLVHRHLEEKGVQLHLGIGLETIEELNQKLRINLSNQDSVDVDFVILAIGVKPDTTFLAQTGLAMNARGALKVNNHMQTNDPLIYAIGDAVEVLDFVTKQPTMIPLAGPANKQGRIVANHIAGRHSAFQGSQGSAVIKVFDLTIAVTGVNEKTTQRLQTSYEKVFTNSANHATYYPGATYMKIKTLFDPTNGKILGAQIVGYDGVDKRADVLATAVRHQLTAYDLAELELTYAPPYSSAKDPVNMIGFVIENILHQDLAIFHWHEVAKLQQDNMTQWLDVRDEDEVELGKIPGAITIPLNQLRVSLSKLDSSRPVYVYCQIGIRGYLACRILKQHGFKCFNLSGGYELYQAIVQVK